MNEDERCCGTGTCMINADGLCWCGQQWDGAAMCQPARTDATAPPKEPDPLDMTQGTPS